jgi:hypothetical protein
MLKNRDEILKMNDETLSRHCKLDFFKGSGNGGQKRNKTSSAVRVQLSETDFVATDCSERSQHRNRANALAKLRRAIAYGERLTPPSAPDHLECALDHPDYPLYLAHLLDIADAVNYDHRSIADFLGCTPSALLKKFARDPELWQFINANRVKRGLTSLKAP